MSAVDDKKKSRRGALVSWIGSLAAMLFLGWLHLVPLDAFAPFVALASGSVFIVLFMRKNLARCRACGERMKISSDYPRIVYRGTQCHAEADTGTNSDYY